MAFLDKREKRLETYRGWAVVAIVSLVAIVRAATAPGLPSQPAAAEAQRREVFVVIAGEERKMRQMAAKDFPADPWSQDDAFHNLEFKRAKTLAGERSMRLADVLRAIDEGMRERWPRPLDVWLNPSVPPCRPRPIH